MVNALIAFTLTVLLQSDDYSSVAKVHASLRPAGSPSSGGGGVRAAIHYRLITVLITMLKFAGPSAHGVSDLAPAALLLLCCFFLH